MRVVVIANPASGRGRSLAAADRICSALAARGIVPTRLPLDASSADLESACIGALAIVAVGGDGTVRSVSARVAGGSIPLAIVPAGTENLAAREFGFQCSPAALADRILAQQERSVDLGVIRRAGLPDHAFLVMVSAGFDADVVAALAARRRGPVTYLTYLLPILALLRHWQAPGFVAESGELGDAPADRIEAAGQLIIANARQYALRLNPARGADPADGLLDAVVLPARGGWSMVRWAIRLALTRGAVSGAWSAQGSVWRVQFDRPTMIQADGDSVAGGPVEQMEVALRPGALRMIDMRGA
ncbi:MAG: diacylglycerol kinase family protein [Planctomycetota bacterium]|nr:diacylglycerol kinase family protein [Planctomycetota bacterium]